MSKIPTIALIPSGYKANKVYSVLPTNGDGDLTFARTSARTRVNEIGLVEDLLTGVPAIDYTNGGCPVLNLGPSSQNLLQYTEDFTNASWIKSPAPTITPDSTIAPNGTLTADELTISPSQYAYQNISLTTGLVYTISIYVKVLSGTNNFKMTTFATGGTNDFTSSEFTATTEWQRFEFSFTANNTISTGIYPLIVDGLAGGDFYVWGAQFEQQSYATSYIQNLGATLNTRTIETVSKTGLGDYINSNEGTFFLHLEGNAVNYSDRRITLSDGSVNNKILLFYAASGDIVQVFITSGALDQVSITLPISQIGFNKIAISYQENNTKVYLNGSQVDVTDTNCAMPLNLSRLAFDGGDFGNPFFGKVKDLRVYNEALSDTELATLTT